MSESIYTDAEILISTQVAYLDIDTKKYKNVGDAIAEMKETLQGDLKGKDKNQKETLDNLINLCEENDIDISDWKVVDRYDSKSGMYACVIDTGGGNAIVGFRGSEGYDTEQKHKDWITSDFGLANTALTVQQADAEEYMEEVCKKYGKRFKSFTTSGHSLGGNLASHAGLTAPEGMKIDRIYNLDGPGNSSEYYAMHKKECQERGHLVDHVQWSLVGVIFDPVPGSAVRFAETTDILDSDFKTVDGPLGGFRMSNRHHTANVVLNGDGSFVEGEPHFIESAVDGLSGGLDDLIQSGGTGETETEVELDVGVKALYDASDRLIGIGRELSAIAADFAEVNKILVFFQHSFLRRIHASETAVLLDLDCNAITSLGGALATVGQIYEEGEDQISKL